MSQTNLTKINLYEKTISSMTTTSVQPDDEYSIKDMPIGGITNAQMLQALDSTKKGLFKVGAIYQCTDEGTYTKGQFYKFTGIEWEESPIPISVDSEMSATSENPVQNKVVKQYVDNATSREEIIKKLPNFKSSIFLSISIGTTSTYTITMVESSNFYVVATLTNGTVLFEHYYPDPTTSITITFNMPTGEGYVNIDFYGNWLGLAGNSGGLSGNLDRVYYDSNITQLPYNAFNNNSMIKTCVCKYPVYLNGYAFYSCTQLSGGDMKTLIERAPSEGQISSYCFYRCTGLTGCLEIDKQNGIQSYGLARTNITSVKFNNGIVNYLSSNCFSQCNYLSYVEINKGSSDYGYINADAFYRCRSLKTLKLNHPLITLYGTLNSHSTDVFDTNFVILVPYNLLNSYKTATNWSTYANKIYPIGGQYSETVSISSGSWTLNSQTNLYEATVTVVGATNESRNVIEYSLVDSNGVQIEDTYGLGAKTQASRSVTFTAQTAPTSAINIFVKSTLTNYQE